MSEWVECTISDIGTVVGGATPSTKKSENYVDGKIAWITPKDLSTFKGRYIVSGERNITESGLKSCSTKLLPKNTVLFSSRAPIGYIAIAANDLCTNQGFKSVIPNENTDPLFLYYLLKFNKDKIESMGSGTTFKEISAKVMKSIKVFVPISKSMQKNIASILGAIDNKIELNNSINNNLLQQAQVLYKDWFFDFSPFSTEGSLPDGWHLGTVGDIIQLHDSKRIPLSGSERDKMEKVYPYYGATSLMDYVDNYIFDGIYLLLGEDGTVVNSLGFPILQYVYGQFWVNNHAHIITGKEGFSVEELYLFFSLTNIKSIVTGAVQQKVSQQNLKKVPAIIPSKESLSAFDNLIQPIFAQIRNLRDENAHLADLRDTLLPRLMSGELDVSNIDI
ncbi:MAG: restriction endonuclease subunit S [Catenibacterium mitsuokai]|nr:restriction endonuclease subunit S [Catenibacterium mitsuokai]MDD6595598.1 restriction endonuclease subunit S [Catenibacterium mitsuokai]